jgi:hypothetical protein
MIIVKNSGYLYYKNFKCRCALGKNGIKNKIKEGDKITPKGTFKIGNLYYRSDKIKYLKTKLTKIRISKDMGWCDDSKSINYNKLIKLPSTSNHEKLYRKDRIYDLILIIHYNTKPIIKKKGSAIFLHISKNNYSPTNGCVAIKKIDFIKLLKILKKNSYIKLF